MRIIKSHDNYCSLCLEIFGEENVDTMEFPSLQLLFLTADDKTLPGVIQWICELKDAANNGRNLFAEFVEQCVKNWCPDKRDMNLEHIATQADILCCWLRVPLPGDTGEGHDLRKLCSLLTTICNICELYMDYMGADLNVSDFYTEDGKRLWDNGEKSAGGGPTERLDQSVGKDFVRDVVSKLKLTSR